jgi:hypothetical protein
MNLFLLHQQGFVGCQTLANTNFGLGFDRRIVSVAQSTVSAISRWLECSAQMETPAMVVGADSGPKTDWSVGAKSVGTPIQVGNY